MKMWLFIPVCIILSIASSTAIAGKNEWTTDGPFGGTFVDVTFDPRGNNLAFAASENGVFRSLNNGKTWTRTDAIRGPVLIHPKDPDRILAGSGPIFLSIDKGKTWQEFASDGIPFFLNVIRFHPVDPQILYAISHFEGVFKSTDGGLNWVAKNNGLDFEANPKLFSSVQIDIDSKNGKTLYAMPANGLVFKSENGGELWRKVNLSFKTGGQVLKIDPNNPKVVYSGGDFSVLFKTTNGGKTWVDTKCNCEPHDVAIDPGNSRSVYLATCGGEALHSVDAGKSWQRVSLDDPGCRYTVSLHPKNSKILLFGRDSFGIERSIDGGKKWKPVTNRLDSFETRRMEIHPSRPGQFYANNGARLFRSNLLGKAFETVLKNVNIFAFDLHPKDPDIIAIGGDHAFWISKDGGKTVTENLDFERCPITSCVAFHSQNPQIIYLVPQDKRDNSTIWPVLGVAKSTNFGETFKLFNTGLSDKKISVMTVASQNGDVVYVGTETGKVFRTTNAGKNWKNSSAGLKGARILSVAIHPTKINVVFVGDSNGRIFKSTNGGNQWIQKLQIDNFRFQQIATDPRDDSVIYAGASPYGLYISADEGETWSTFDTTGLGNFGVLSIDFPPPISDAAAATLTIGTQHGVFSFTKVRENGDPIDATTPSITSILPAAQAADEIITISGKSFGSIPGQVNFNDASGITAESWTDTRITVRVPNSAGIGKVTVIAASEESNGLDFTPLPTTGRFLPTEGSAEGGYEISIIDTNGAARSGANFFVSFGGEIVSGSNCETVEQNVLVCPVPAGTPGEAEITLNNNSGNESIGIFTYR